MELARPCYEATRKEKGCIRYELFLSCEDDVTLQFVEEWTDLDSLRAHLKSPHLAEFKKKRKSKADTTGAILKLFDAKEVSLD